MSLKYLERKELFELLKLEDNFKNPFDFGPDFHVLDALTRYIKPKLSLEIGTCKGFSTSIIAKNSENLITVDIHPSRKYLSNPIQAQEVQPIERIGFASFQFDNIHQILTDSLNLPLFFQYPIFDFIYLDGCHDTKHLIPDTELAIKVLKAPGILCWHDYKNPDVPDVTSYLDELSEDIPGIIHTSKWTVFKGVKE